MFRNPQHFFLFLPVTDVWTKKWTRTSRISTKLLVPDKPFKCPFSHRWISAQANKPRKDLGFLSLGGLSKQWHSSTQHLIRTHSRQGSRLCTWHASSPLTLSVTSRNLSSSAQHHSPQWGHTRMAKVDHRQPALRRQAHYPQSESWRMLINEHSVSLATLLPFYFILSLDLVSLHMGTSWSSASLLLPLPQLPGWSSESRPPMVLGSSLEPLASGLSPLSAHGTWQTALWLLSWLPFQENERSWKTGTLSFIIVSAGLCEMGSPIPSLPIRWFSTPGCTFRIT